jgi:hypothetical protein
MKIDFSFICNGFRIRSRDAFGGPIWLLSQCPAPFSTCEGIMIIHS